MSIPGLAPWHRPEADWVGVRLRLLSILYSEMRLTPSERARRLYERSMAVVEAWESVGWELPYTVTSYTSSTGAGNMFHWADGTVTEVTL